MPNMKNKFPFIALFCLIFNAEMGAAYGQGSNNSPDKALTVTVQSSDSAQKKELDKRTANAVNTIPGVKVKAGDLATPELPPIKGFHPIKRALRPVENLAVLSTRLQQQIVRMEGPIASLQPTMINLHNKMTVVNNRLKSMQGNIVQAQTQVAGARQEVTGVREDIQGVRADILAIRRELEDLRSPIQELKKPLGNVAGPLVGVQKRLEEVQALIGAVLLFIMLSTVMIAIGTPIAALLIYKNRRKFFPDLKDSELDLGTKMPEDRQLAKQLPHHY